LVRFTRASRDRAELCHREARVDAWLAEVAGERLGEQVALQVVGEVGPAEAPERLATPADQSRVGEHAAASALDGGQRARHGAQRVPVASGEGEQNRREGVARGACWVVARESRVGGGREQLESRAA